MNKQKDTSAVNAALDEVKKIWKLRSDRQLAYLLDLEKQNVAAWRAKGEVPAARAIQIEVLTDKEVTWQMLCPRLYAQTLELMDK